MLDQDISKMSKKLKRFPSKSMVPSNGIVTRYDCICVLKLSHQGKVLSLILKQTKNQLKTEGVEGDVLSLFLSHINFGGLN